MKRISSLLLAGLFMLHLTIALVAGCGNGGSGKPAMSRISPGKVEPGGEVTIQGERFDELQGEGIVRIGGELASAIFWSDTEITAIVPHGLPQGNRELVVLTPEGRSNALSTSKS